MGNHFIVGLLLVTTIVFSVSELFGDCNMNYSTAESGMSMYEVFSDAMDCPHDNLVEDTHGGVIICTQCGTVLEQLYSSFVRNPDQQEDGPAQAPAARTETINHFIQITKNEPDAVLNFNKVIELLRSNGVPSLDENGPIVHRAYELYGEVRHAGQKFTGHNKLAFCAAALYLAALSHKAPITLRDFADALYQQRSHLSRAAICSAAHVFFKHAPDTLRGVAMENADGKPMPHVFSPPQFIPRFVQNLRSLVQEQINLKGLMRTNGDEYKSYSQLRAENMDWTGFERRATAIATALPNWVSLRSYEAPDVAAAAIAITCKMFGLPTSHVLATSRMIQRMADIKSELLYYILKEVWNHSQARTELVQLCKRL